MLRQLMGSLRLLQNECMVFVPAGACGESAVWFEVVVLDWSSRSGWSQLATHYSASKTI